MKTKYGTEKIFKETFLSSKETWSKYCKDASWVIKKLLKNGQPWRILFTGL